MLQRVQRHAAVDARPTRLQAQRSQHHPGVQERRGWSGRSDIGLHQPGVDPQITQLGAPRHGCAQGKHQDCVQPRVAIHGQEAEPPQRQAAVAHDSRYERKEVTAVIRVEKDREFAQSGQEP
jgi:hypothetical protein